MTTEIILANTFFGFWYILGKYYIAIWGMAIFLSIFIALYYLICKR